MGGGRPGDTTTMDSTTSNLIFRLLLSLPAETIDGLANTGQTKSPKNRVEKICLQRYPDLCSSAKKKIRENMKSGQI